MKANERMNKQLQMLSSIPLFRGLSAGEISEIATCMTQRTVERGEVLFQLGQPSDAAYIVVSGDLSAFLQTAQQVQEIVRFNDESFFGELCLIKEGPRALTVRANSSSTLLRLDRVKFTDLRSQRSTAAYRFIRNICVTACDRLRTTNQFIEVEVQHGEQSVQTLGQKKTRMGTLKEKLGSFFGGKGR